VDRNEGTSHASSIVVTPHLVFRQQVYALEHRGEGLYVDDVHRLKADNWIYIISMSSKLSEPRDSGVHLVQYTNNPLATSWG
jgi:hypothetical protein